MTLPSIADQTRTVLPREPEEPMPTNYKEAVERVKAQPFRFPELAARFEAQIGKAMKKEAKNAPVFKGTSEVGRSAIVKKRQNLVMTLLKDWRSAPEIEAITGEGISTVSKDLGALKERGLVEMRRDGARFYYRSLED